MLSNAEVRETVQQAESLLERVEHLQDEQAQLIAVNAVRALMSLYGEALARVMKHVEDNAALLERLTTDELISHLLLVHDLHPVPVSQRINRALQELEPTLQSHDAGAELLHIEQEVATIRLSAKRSLGTHRMREAVRRAVLQAAPELVGVQIEDASSAGKQQPAGFVPLDTLTSLWESKNSG